MNPFEELLKELSVLLGIGLHVDKNGACKLLFENTFHIQIEYNSSRQALLIASFIGEIPPGKFRENLLKDALKANCPFPQDGILGYSERNNQLTLSQWIPLRELSAQKLHDLLQTCMNKVKVWHKNLS